MMLHLRQLNLRRLARDPLGLCALLWPLILLTPHLPGLPRPSIGTLPWRQELALALLLALTLAALLCKRTGAHAAHAPSTPPLQSRLLLCGGLFAFWVWLSATWAAYPSAAVHLAFQWSAYLIFLALMVGVASRTRLLSLSCIGLGVVVWILGLACACESWFGATLTDGNLRSDLKPLLRGSGGFGEIMAVAAPLYAALAFGARRPHRALVCGATATLAWLATLQSLERAPFIGAAAGLLLFFTASLVKANCRPRRPARLWLLAAAFACVLAFQSLPARLFAADAQASRVSTLTRLQSGVGEDGNTRVRLLFWGVGLEMWRAHPFVGVGGNNYEVAYPQARAQFSATHPQSPLINLNEHLLAVYAHNEYVQILAELGATGLLLFLVFVTALALAVARALRHPTRARDALGACAGMLAFAISSGASASSFRYLGGGLLFFFAAAVVAHVASLVGDEAASPAQAQAPRVRFRLSMRARGACACVALVLMCAMSCDFGARAAATMLHGLAQTSADAARAEALYRSSLRLDAQSASAHFGYGTWLVAHGRTTEALAHLRYAVRGGFNNSTSYAYLAGAEEAAGDPVAAAATLGEAVGVYPRSVFLRVRHAATLERQGRAREAALEMAAANLIDSRAARGWYQLIVNDVDAAADAARQDAGVATPGELSPQDGVFLVLAENERRRPEAARSAWRARMRAATLP